nr:hypothetical protein [Tanacetum cinerariifolium]
MALLNEHLLTFSQYKDAKTLFKAIQARFGGNDATKKTQKILLKQMYENFNAPSTESLDSIFNMLHKIVSQLAILGENISPEDLNMKFLRSLPSKWNTHVVVWRNKANLDTMSIDDLYNNFKIIEQEVKRMVTSSSRSRSQNMAFLSSPGNLEQIHEDDLEEIDLKWQLALLSMRARRSPKNQESMPRNQDSSRKTVNVEDTSSKAMVAIDGAGFDWSYMADDEVSTNMALIAFSDSEEFQHPEFEGYGPQASKSVSVNTSNESKKAPDALIIKDWVFDYEEDECEEKLFKTAAPVSIARPINTAAPKPLVNVAKPRQNTLQKSHSLSRRPFSQQTTLENRNLNNTINTAKVNTVNTAKGNRVTSVVGKQGINAVKSSACWVWKPKQDHVSKNNRSYICKRFDYGDPQDALKDTRIFDSGCSRYITGNKSYLTNYQEYDGGFVAFAGSSKGEGKAAQSLLNEFKNYEMNQFCEIKGIKREFSNARTSQQNGVAKRKNMTLIEAARTIAGHRTNGNAGSKINSNAGQAKKEKVPDQEYILVPLLNTCSDVPSSHEEVESSPKDDANKKSTVEPTCVKGGKTANLGSLDHQMKSTDDSENTNSTNSFNTASLTVNVASNKDETFQRTNNEWDFSTPIIVNAASSFFNHLAALHDYSKMPNLEDTRIFDDAYDDRDEGAGADYNNLETVISIIPILSTRIHKDHPKEQIIKEVNSVVQTRKMAKQNEAGLITFINKQRRTNHNDFQNCLFACFLSQVESKKVTRALDDET